MPFMHAQYRSYFRKYVSMQYQLSSQKLAKNQGQNIVYLIIIICMRKLKMHT